MKKTLGILLVILSCAVTVKAQIMSYDMTKPQPKYDDSVGYGYDITDAPTAKSTSPFYFSVNVPDGNYRVTVTLGSKKRAAETTVRAESRRMMIEKCVTKKGQFETLSFVVNKRNTDIPEYKTADGKMTKASKVRIKPGEVGSMTWDDKLTLEFNGACPAVKTITIEPDDKAITLFLCGNSTVVDQGKEPWASWGQMFPRWFNDKICVANYGESGLTATSFLAQNRLEKILSAMKAGDYVFCEFGHNDEKEKGPGTGAWYHYSVSLKKFVDMVRAKGGNVIFCTPTQRRFFEKNGTIRNTHGEFPEAMKAVAKREKVPCIDLNATTKTLFEAMGNEGSKHLLVHYPMGTFPWQIKEFADNTHFNPFGAYEVSKLIVMGLKQMNSPLVEYLKDDWKDFSPSQPDNWETFYWPQSVLFDGKKPDGN